MPNAADRKQVRAAEKRAKLADQNRREVIAGIASSEPGRRYLWDRLAEAGVFTTSYNDNPQRMAFAEGLRSAGLALLDDFMSASPDNFIVAMREANARRTERDTADAAAEQRAGSEESGWESEDYSAAFAIDPAAGEGEYH